jgi:fructose-1-phosphate kinase PfkB-like protein
MEKDIGKIRKNDTSEIIIRVDDFGGRKGLTIREFVTSERYTGFTKAGVRILSSDFEKFKEMINSVSDEDMAEVEGSEPKESQRTFKPKATPKKSAADEELPDY